MATSTAKEDQQFGQIAGEIGVQISSIQSNAKQIQSLAVRVGTEQDTGAMRQQLHSLTHATKALCQSAADRLRTGLAPFCVGLTAGARRAQKDRLVDQLAKAAGDFQEAQRLVQTREREIVAKQRQAASGLEAAINGTAGDGGGGGGNDDGEDANPFGFARVSAQQQAQAQQDLQAAEERESQLHQLEQDIVGINEMFKDLAQMVHEQGDMLDSIEDHVGQATMQVEEGSKNLKQAVTYQKSARRKKIIIAVIVIVALAILAVIIYFAVPKS